MIRNPMDGRVLRFYFPEVTVIDEKHIFNLLWEKNHELFIENSKSINIEEFVDEF
jgi:hypothetical protein